MSLTTLRTRGKLLRAGIVAAVAASAVVATASSSDAAVLVMTSSAVSGPVTGANTLVLNLVTTNTTPASNKFTSGSVGIQFQSVAAAANQASSGASATACSAAPMTSGAFANVTAMRFVTNTKVTATVPNMSAVNGATGFWIICAYDKVLSDSSGQAIGRVGYTTAAQPTITSVNGFTQTAGPGSTQNNPVALSSSNVAVKGSSTGGTSITVVGTNFPTATSGISVLLGATVTGGTTSNGIITGGTVVGGSAATITAASLTATGFTATLPARVGSDVNLTITTAGGSVTFTHAFTSINGITISPNSVVQGASVDIDVIGAGFTGSAFSFTNTGTASTGAGAVSGQDDATSHVFLVRGVYDPSGYSPATNTGAPKANPQVAECVDVFVISDVELICTLNSAKSAAFDAAASSGSGWTYPSTQIPLGAYTLVVVDKADLTSAPTNRTAVSAGSTFTVAQF